MNILDIALPLIIKSLYITALIAGPALYMIGALHKKVFATIAGYILSAIAAVAIIITTFSDAPILQVIFLVLATGVNTCICFVLVILFNKRAARRIQAEMFPKDWEEE